MFIYASFKVLMCETEPSSGAQKTDNGGFKLNVLKEKNITVQLLTV